MFRVSEEACSHHCKTGVDRIRNTKWCRSSATLEFNYCDESAGSCDLNIQPLMDVSDYSIDMKKCYSRLSESRAAASDTSTSTVVHARHFSFRMPRGSRNLERSCLLPHTSTALGVTLSRWSVAFGNYACYLHSHFLALILSQG